MNTVRWCVFLLGALVLSGWATASDPGLQAVPELRQPQPNRLSGGAIDAAALERLEQAGVRRVIDLRADSETPQFDEAQEAARLGMSYHSLPVTSLESLNLDNARKLDQLLEQSGDELTLVHCASGNRVGALIAVREVWLRNATVEQAIAEGRRWGLTKWESAVRAVLEE